MTTESPRFAHFWMRQADISPRLPSLEAQSTATAVLIIPAGSQLIGTGIFWMGCLEQHAI